MRVRGTLAGGSYVGMHEGAGSVLKGLKCKSARVCMRKFNKIQVAEVDLELHTTMDIIFSLVLHFQKVC